MATPRSLNFLPDRPLTPFKIRERFSLWWEDLEGAQSTKTPEEIEREEALEKQRYETKGEAILSMMPSDPDWKTYVTTIIKWNFTAGQLGWLSEQEDWRHRLNKLFHDRSEFDLVMIDCPKYLREQRSQEELASAQKALRARLLEKSCGIGVSVQN